MNNNRNWNGIRATVAEYCKDNNISDSDFRFLNLFEWQNIYNNVLDTFLDYQYAKYNGLYWSNVENGFKKSITRLFCFQEGAKGYPSYEWIMKLPQIIGSDTVYLLLEESSNKYWIAECNPGVIHQIINEALYPLDFYITDKKYNWIITKNHHDIVQFLGQGLDEQEIRSVLMIE